MDAGVAGGRGLHQMGARILGMGREKQVLAAVYFFGRSDSSSVNRRRVQSASAANADTSHSIRIREYKSYLIWRSQDGATPPISPEGTGTVAYNAAIATSVGAAVAIGGGVLFLLSRTRERAVVTAAPTRGGAVATLSSTF